jgi:hypothetical protein
MVSAITLNALVPILLLLVVLATDFWLHCLRFAFGGQYQVSLVAGWGLLSAVGRRRTGGVPWSTLHLADGLVV